MQCGHLIPLARKRSRQRLQRRRIYGEAIRDALIALWEASDRVCGKRLKVMIPVLLLPALERQPDSTRTFFNLFQAKGVAAVKAPRF